jgi:hypothetical protein
LKLFATSLFALSLAAFAQPARAFDFPRPSPNAKLTQTVGLTDITVDYSSPAVHGREIWGSLEKWDAVWRAGANATTKVTFSRDVIIGSTAVPAGSYAFFVIPNQTSAWTVILNKDFTQGGSFGYDQKLDVVRIDAAPQPIPNRERLAYLFSNFDDEGGSLDLEWEKVRVSLPFKLGTAAQVREGLAQGEDSLWELDNQAANYERNVKKNYDAALAYVEKSIKLRETWSNLWTKAQIEAAKGNTKAAIATAEKAQKVGGSSAPKGFQETSAKSIAEWKSKK